MGLVHVESNHIATIFSLSLAEYITMLQSCIKNRDPNWQLHYFDINSLILCLSEIEKTIVNMGLAKVFKKTTFDGDSNVIAKRMEICVIEMQVYAFIKLIQIPREIKNSYLYIYFIIKNGLFDFIHQKASELSIKLKRIYLEIFADMPVYRNCSEEKVEDNLQEIEKEDKENEEDSDEDDDDDDETNKKCITKFTEYAISSALSGCIELLAKINAPRLLYYFHFLLQITEAMYSLGFFEKNFTNADREDEFRRLWDLMIVEISSIAPYIENFGKFIQEEKILDQRNHDKIERILETFGNQMIQYYIKIPQEKPYENDSTIINLEIAFKKDWLRRVNLARNLF